MKTFKITNSKIKLRDDSVVVGALFVCVIVAFCLGFLAFVLLWDGQRGLFIAVRRQTLQALGIMKIT